MILRSGKNAREAIEHVKTKLEPLKKGLPAGVELVTVYDRSQLIDRAVENLSRKRPAKSLPNSSIKGDGVRVFLSGRDHPYRRDFHAPTKLLP